MEVRWYFKEKYIGFNGRASDQRKTRSTKLICQLCLKLMLLPIWIFGWETEKEGWRWRRENKV